MTKQDEFNRKHGLPKDLKVKGVMLIGAKHLPNNDHDGNARKVKIVEAK